MKSRFWRYIWSLNHNSVNHWHSWHLGLSSLGLSPHNTVILHNLHLQLRSKSMLPITIFILIILSKLWCWLLISVHHMQSLDYLFIWYNINWLLKKFVYLYWQLRRVIRQKHTLPNHKMRFKPLFQKPEALPPAIRLELGGQSISSGRLCITFIKCTRLPLVAHEATLYCILCAGVCLL